MNTMIGHQTDFHDTMDKAHLTALSVYCLTLHITHITGSDKTHIKVQFQQKYPLKNFLSPKK